MSCCPTTDTAALKSTPLHRRIHFIIRECSYCCW
ncbi:unnamed protein product [Penicillium roqueforti FM164]|uniref:Genomic scaffold, ProqFM164S02 n=1 Tax=Penicillium roqueforti (strain FM164) TaxID=1365484 RepID=W6Q5A4_PENRF|nr:unnamed protein product [Penicillium roqueforti FM164]